MYLPSKVGEKLAIANIDITADDILENKSPDKTFQ
jgi:hypothetical protein